MEISDDQNRLAMIGSDRAAQGYVKVVGSDLLGQSAAVSALPRPSATAGRSSTRTSWSGNESQRHISPDNGWGRRAGRHFTTLSILSPFIRS
jgi:hypothetical protein